MHKMLARLLEIRAPGSPARAPVAGEIRAEIVAGIVASIVTLVHCLSFSALIFSGALRDGLSFGLWGFMAASALTSLAAALTTTLPPYLAGPRNPVVAVMGALAAVITADVMTGGGSAASALRHVLLAFSLAGFLTGAALWLLGRFHLGQIVRFVPYPVIGGFLAASGWLLITGGLTLSIGKPLVWATLASLTTADGLRLLVAILFAGTVAGLRRFGAGSIALPLLFLSAAAVLDLVLSIAGLRAGWFLDGTPAAHVWSPFGILQQGFGSSEPVQPHILLRATVEIMTIAAVSVFAMPLDFSSLEVQRGADADIDTEFRSTGAANAVLAMLGGLPVGLAPNTSRLADELGATSRLAGLAAGAFVGVVLLAGLDFAALIPTPLLAGLVVFLGLTVIADVFAGQSGGQSGGQSWRQSNSGSWGETVLTLAIMLAIVRFGYLAGIVFGLVAACLLFAVRYSRIETIRRHVTRAEFASGIERAAAEQAALLQAGDRIHILWLTGYIFFGSANRIFDQIRNRMEGDKRASAHDPDAAAPPRRWMVLELSGVSGIDSSALVTFRKLQTWARSHNLILVLAGVSATLVSGLGLTVANETQVSANRLVPSPVFPNRADALSWCEDALLADLRDADGDVAGQSLATGSPDFTSWLGSAIGVDAAERLAGRYLVLRSLAPGECLCREGEPADALHFVASGSLAITVGDAHGRAATIRRMNGHTVVGEMGFFRKGVRTASVVADSATTVFALDRRAYDALAENDPALARALLEFVVRIQADRVEFANREVAALI